MSDSPSNNLTFEQALAELEQIVRELEDGQVGLEESLSRYEVGVRLLKRCYQQLSQAEQRILRLTGVDEDGSPLTAEFDHTATNPDPAEPPRRRRKGGDPEKRV
jgi:exodeoxyribonuclease VII small subunit